MSDYIQVCPACLEECRTVTQDHGIGHYEYWGAKGVDKRIATLTDCCDATPQEAPHFRSQDVDPCHLNGGDVVCSKCPAKSVCMDALPFEEDV